MDYNKIFEDAHAEGVDLLGTRWITINERATRIASMLGIDYRDKEMRAFISKIVLETVYGILELDNIQREILEKKFIELQNDNRKITDKEKAKGRSENYYQLSPKEQWDEDKRLGILDWDGK